LQSSPTTEKRSSAELGLALALPLLALGLVHCGRTREEKPHAPKPAQAEGTAMPEVAPAPSALAEPEAPVGPPAASEATEQAAAEPGDLRSVTAEALLGEVRRLGGKGTLVNVWASWCGPCKHEIPMLEKLAATLAPRGVHVLLVSVDEPGDADKARAFLRERRIALKSYLAERPLGVFKQGLNPRWPGMVPASFLYDASSALRYFWGGEAFEEELRPVLDAFAAGKPIQGEADVQVAPEGEVH